MGIGGTDVVLQDQRVCPRRGRGAEAGMTELERCGPIDARHERGDERPMAGIEAVGAGTVHRLLGELFLQTIEDFVQVHDQKVQAVAVVARAADEPHHRGTGYGGMRVEAGGSGRESRQALLERFEFGDDDALSRGQAQGFEHGLDQGEQAHLHVLEIDDPVGLATDGTRVVHELVQAGVIEPDLETLTRQAVDFRFRVIGLEQSVLQQAEQVLGLLVGDQRSRQPRRQEQRGLTEIVDDTGFHRDHDGGETSATGRGVT